MSSQSHSSNGLDWLDLEIKTEFNHQKNLLSFDEYLAIMVTHPNRQLRASAGYTADMMDYFGFTESTTAELKRFKIFEGMGLAKKVIGHEEVQTHLYRSLRSFEKLGYTNKLILLHGPNGSAKSSIAQALIAGLESYSHTDEGAIYTFSWIFPNESLTKGPLGLGKSIKEADSHTFSKLTEDQIAVKLTSELKDHPLCLIPIKKRKEFLSKVLGETQFQKIWSKLPKSLKQGQLSHRSQDIFDSLLKTHQGDYKKVLKYVQVERIFLSGAFRKGLVTVEPQMHVDAQIQQLTMNRQLGQLPPSLQNLNLFTVMGDLVDGNRGLIEYSDLLKRPVDTFKYLLNVCETSQVNVGVTLLQLDTVLIGSCNELQLDAFKEYPDFTSFKARIELIRVPYLLSVSEEKEIYQEDLAQLALSKAVSPHCDWTLALWAVLTRMKKPNAITYAPGLSSLMASLTPLEKVKLLDKNPEFRADLSGEDRKSLKSSLKQIKNEYQNIPYFEGRMGASPREMKSILYAASQNNEFPCLSPLSILREMENFTKRISEYDFLRQDIREGYHDCNDFITTVRTEYLNIIDKEVRDSLGLYDSNQWEDFIKKYVSHLSLLLKNEKHKNTHTGQLEDPDQELMKEFEKIVEAPQSSTELQNFRQAVLSQIGAWSLEHPKTKVEYSKIFPEYWKKLEKFYYKGQKETLDQMYKALMIYEKETDPGHKLAKQTIQNMKKLGYSEEGAKEVILFLMKSRYQ